MFLSLSLSFSLCSSQVQGRSVTWLHWRPPWLVPNAPQPKSCGGKSQSSLIRLALHLVSDSSLPPTHNYRPPPPSRRKRLWVVAILFLSSFPFSLGLFIGLRFALVVGAVLPKRSSYQLLSSSLRRLCPPYACLLCSFASPAVFSDPFSPEITPSNSISSCNNVPTTSLSTSRIARLRWKGIRE